MEEEKLEEFNEILGTLLDIHRRTGTPIGISIGHRIEGMAIENEIVLKDVPSAVTDMLHGMGYGLQIIQGEAIIKKYRF